MDAVFVDWNVEFAEVEGAPYPVYVAAPVRYRGEVILWVRLVWAYQTSKKVGGVAMHTLQSWVDNCTRYVGYDLVVEPLARVQGEDALVAD